MTNRKFDAVFTDWDFDDVVVELARYVDKGFHITNVSFSHSVHGLMLEVELEERHKI